MPQAFSSSLGKSSNAKHPNLASRFVEDVKQTVGGVLPGMVMLGGAAAGDVGRGVQEIATGGRADTHFRLPALGENIARGFWNTSFIPALATGHPREALHRVSERPFSALLDVGSFGLGGAGLAGKALVRAGDVTAPGFRSLTGYRPISEVASPEIVKGLTEGNVLDSLVARQGTFDVGPTRFKSMQFGKDLYARPVGRMITPDIETLTPDIWSGRSKNEFAARMGDIVHSKLMEVNPSTPIIGAGPRIYKGLMKGLYSHRSYNLDLFDREFDQKVKDMEKQIKVAYPDMRDDARNHALNIAIVLARKGYENANDYLNRKGLYYGEHVINENGIPIYRPVEGGAQDHIAELASDLSEKEIKLARLNYRTMQNKSQLDDLNMDPLVGDAVKKFHDGLDQKNLTELAKLSMDVERTSKNLSSVQRNLDDFISNGGNTHWAKHLDEINKYRDELNVIMDDKPVAMQPFLDYLKELEPRLEAMYLTNTHGAWDAADLSKFKLRDVYSGPSKEIPKRRVRGRVSENGTPIYDQPGFVPAYKNIPENKASHTDYIGKPIDNRNVLMQEHRLSTDPEDLIYSGNERMDISIFKDKFRDEANTFANNSWREDVSKMFQNVNGVELREYLKNDQAHIPDSLTGAIKKNTPLIAVSTNGALANEIVRINSIFDDTLEELLRSGNVTAAERMNKLRTEFDVGGASSKTLARAMLRTHPGRLFGELGAGHDLSPTGNYLLMPRHIYESFVADAGRSKHFIMKALEKPTEVWKNMVLHLRPKWIVNNSVGSLMLLMLGEGAPEAARQLFKNSKLRDRAGEAMFGKAWRDVGRGGERHKFEVKQQDGTMVTKELTIPEYIQHVLPELTYSHGSSWLYRSDFLRGSDNKFKQTYSRMMDSIADFNARVADDPARIAKASAIFDRRLGEMRTHIGEMKGEGRVFDHDPSDQELMQLMTSDPKIRAEIVDEVLGDLIDFQDMTPFERQFVRDFVPFWTWIKGSTKVSAKALVEHPIRLGAYGKLSDEANRELTDKYGNLPSYILGSIPAPSFRQNKQGTRVFNLGSASPYNTAGDIAALVASLPPVIGATQPVFGPESPVAMLGPLPKAAIESLTGRDVFFGTPLPRGKSLGSTFASRLIGTPQTTLYSKYFEGFPPKHRPLSPGATSIRSPLFDIASYMGVPHPMDLRLAGTAARAREEQRQLLSR